MPTSGQKDADGYTWNGGNWVSQDGYAKGSAEDKRKNRSGFRNAITDIGNVGRELTKIDTWVDPTGGRKEGILEYLKFGNDLLNPGVNFGKAAQNVRDADSPWDIAKAVGFAGLGAAQVFGGAQGLGGALTAAGRGVKAGTAGARTFQNLNAGLQGTTGLRRGAAVWRGINPSKLGKAASLFGAGSIAYDVGGRLMNKPGQPAASSVLPGRDMSMTAEQRAAMVAANQNRTDAAGNSGMGGRQTVPAGAGAGPGKGSAAAAGNLGLLGLDPDQLAQTGESLTSLEKMYQDALNQYTLAEQQGQQGYTQNVQGARRQATGTEQDLASQLAASGLDISPASAFGAGQIANAPRQAQETAARKSLDQLLAEITTGRTQAKTKRDTDKLMINRLINDYRIKNTLAAQQAGYNAMGGY